MKYNVLISDGLDEAGINYLKKNKKINLIFKKATDFNNNKMQIHGLVVKTATSVDKNILDKFKHLKLVCRVGIGIDHIDVNLCKKRKIKVVNTPLGNRVCTAEHTFALIMALSKNITKAHKSILDFKWERENLKTLELQNKTLGIIGLGRIGTEVAIRAQAFNMKVIACDPFIKLQVAKKLKVPLMSLNKLVSNSHFITLHVPLTELTNQMVNKKLLKLFKKGSYLINASRGAVVCEKDLLFALDKKWLSGAALDVFDKEPLDRNSKLRLNKQVILTPHIAGQSVESGPRLALEAAQCVDTFFK